MPAAGSWITSSSVGFISATMLSISGRGVKYWPAPDFFSSAFFSSSPSYRSPRPSCRALYQSSSSISVDQRREGGRLLDERAGVGEDRLHQRRAVRCRGGAA